MNRTERNRLALMRRWPQMALLAWLTERSQIERDTKAKRARLKRKQHRKHIKRHFKGYAHQTRSGR